jgi:hypothetical protein
VPDSATRRRLLALAEAGALGTLEWWMVDLVCRQGLEVPDAGRRLGLGPAAARRLWREIRGLAGPGPAPRREPG